MMTVEISACSHVCEAHCVTTLDRVPAKMSHSVDTSKQTQNMWLHKHQKAKNNIWLGYTCPECPQCTVQDKLMLDSGWNTKTGLHERNMFTVEREMKADG